MKAQKGFTLIELMVVMAIIAILATAGLAAYGGYIKKARDATRIADLRAIESVILSSLTVNGSAPDWDPELKDAIENMNNGVLLSAPLDGQVICLDTYEYPIACTYVYTICDNGGYVLGTNFESLSNFPLYTQDKLNTNLSNPVNDDNYYELGNCDSISILGGPFNIRE